MNDRSLPDAGAMLAGIKLPDEKETRRKERPAEGNEASNDLISPK